METYTSWRRSITCISNCEWTLWHSAALSGIPTWRYTTAVRINFSILALKHYGKPTLKLHDGKKRQVRGAPNLDAQVHDGDTCKNCSTDSLIESYWSNSQHLVPLIEKSWPKMNLCPIEIMAEEDEWCSLGFLLHAQNNSGIATALIKLRSARQEFCSGFSPKEQMTPVVKPHLSKDWIMP